MIPLVSVIVCHHLPENRKYLDACLRSLEAQEGVDIEVILVHDNYTPDGLPSWAQVHRVPDGYRWVHKVNVGVKKSDPKSKYLLLLNDDAILAKHTIASMAAKAGNNPVILNPMSQCDNGWIFHTPITLRPKEGGSKRLDKRFYAFEELEHFQDAIIHYPRGPELVVQAPYVCFYATMIPRVVWNAVGELDESCKTSHDDEDYCLRARNLGIQSLIDFESFALHFGGATSSTTTSEEDRMATHSYFDKKWGRSV